MLCSVLAKTNTFNRLGRNAFYLYMSLKSNVLLFFSRLSIESQMDSFSEICFQFTIHHYSWQFNKSARFFLLSWNDILAVCCVVIYFCVSTSKLYINLFKQKIIHSFLLKILSNDRMVRKLRITKPHLFVFHYNPLKFNAFAIRKCSRLIDGE